MKIKYFWAVCCILLITNIVHAEVNLKSNYPAQYTVKSGDTLWDIAGVYLEKPWHWPALWEKNDQIKNPHLIYPGDVLVITMVNGKPRLQKASSASTQQQPISTIHYDAVKSFLRNAKILTPEEFSAAPYVLAGAEERLLSAAGDKVHVKGMLNENATYQICREGESYVDPQSNEILGFEAMVVGESYLLSQMDNVATIQVKRSNQEVRIGDRVFAMSPQDALPIFQPNYPTVTEGQIIAVLDGVTEVGQFNVVVINRGTREGMSLGNVFAIHKKGGHAEDPVTHEVVTLPTVMAGQLVIFKTFEKLSYGLVTKANRPLAVMDEIQQPL